MIEIRQLSAADSDHTQRLAEILIDCVDSGASVSFLPPLLHPVAQEYFRGIFADLAEAKRILLVALLDEEIVGTVQAVIRLPQNQPHRAEISKLLVHRDARGRGIASALMNAIEAVTVRLGKTLLVLDTAVGGGAEALYERLGYTRSGIIPDFALLPDGSLCATAIYWKKIA